MFRFGGEYTRVNLDKFFPQVFNGQLFFFNAGPGPLGVGGLPTSRISCRARPDFSFGGGGVFNHKYRTNNFAFSLRTTGKSARI